MKALASGFENVVTADLVLSMRKATPDDAVTVTTPPATAMKTAVEEALSAGAPTPTHVYLHVVRSYLRHHWDASDLHMAEIGTELWKRGLDVDAVTGELVQPDGDTLVLFGSQAVRSDAVVDRAAGDAP